MWFIINIKQFRDWSWLLDICRKYLTIFIILLNYFFFLYSRIYIYYSLHDTLLFRYSFSFKRKPLDAKFISQPKDTHFDKNICPLTLSTILELVESNNYAYRISVFPTGTGVTYFMPRLDTQIIEKNIKRDGSRRRAFTVELLSEIEKRGNRSPFPVKNVEKTASGHAAYPVKSSVLFEQICIKVRGENTSRVTSVFCIPLQPFRPSRRHCLWPWYLWTVRHKYSFHWIERTMDIFLNFLFNPTRFPSLLIPRESRVLNIYNKSSTNFLPDPAYFSRFQVLRIYIHSCTRCLKVRTIPWIFIPVIDPRAMNFDISDV